MLVLTRKLGEEIIIDGRIRVVIINRKGGDAYRVGISAPRDVVVDRIEVHRAKEFERKARGAE